MALGGRLWGLLVALALLAPASAAASATQESLLQDDDLLLYGGPGVADRTLTELKLLGVDRVRVSIHWRNVAPARRSDLKDPTDPGSYERSQFDGVDHLLRAARSQGIKVLVTVTGPVPDWAGGELRGRRSVRPSTKAYGQFVEMLGRRWSGSYRDENQGKGVLPRVDAWSLWNEPNWWSSLLPQWRITKRGNPRPVAARMYRRLHRAASAGLERSGHGSDTILLGELAPLGSVQTRATSSIKPVPFLLELFCLRKDLTPMTPAQAARRFCDYDRHGPLAATAFAHHPYTITSAPGVPTTDPDAITLPDAGRLYAILDAAAAAGRIRPREMPVWHTEFGWQTGPPDPFRGVSLTQQAAWIGEAERLSWTDARVAVHGQFLLRDDEPRADQPAGSRSYWGTWQSGLRFDDGTPKPAYAAYRLPLAGPRRIEAGAPLELWGQVRPAHGPTTVTIERKLVSEDTWEPVQQVAVTDPRGYFTTTVVNPREGDYRYVWEAPDTAKQRRFLFFPATDGTTEIASAAVYVAVE